MPSDNRRWQAHKATEQPEMHTISRAGEELAADTLSIMDHQHWGQVLLTVKVSGSEDTPDMDRSYVVLR